MLKGVSVSGETNQTLSSEKDEFTLASLQDRSILEGSEELYRYSNSTIYSIFKSEKLVVSHFSQYESWAVYCIRFNGHAGYHVSREDNYR